MNRVVVDASVVVKWFIPDPALEPDADRAVALLAVIRAGDLHVLQPPHWLAEAGAVLTRLRPEIAEEAMALLAALELPTSQELAIYQRASRISRELNHHLFDTLYHALALEEGATLVTADDTYYRKAKELGGLMTLSEFPLEG